MESLTIGLAMLFLYERHRASKRAVVVRWCSWGVHHDYMSMWADYGCDLRLCEGLTFGGVQCILRTQLLSTGQLDTLYIQFSIRLNMPDDGFVQ